MESFTYGKRLNRSGSCYKGIKDKIAMINRKKKDREDFLRMGNFNIKRKRSKSFGC